MNGMDARTGRPLSGDAHLAQSIGDILGTPIGTRVGLRDYGSLLPELQDAPINPLTRLRTFAATAVAIARWEPRIRLTRVAFGQATADGRAVLDLEGARTDTRAPTDLVRLSIPLHPVPSSSRNA